MQPGFSRIAGFAGRIDACGRAAASVGEARVSLRRVCVRKGLRA